MMVRMVAVVVLLRELISSWSSDWAIVPYTTT